MLPQCSHSLLSPPLPFVVSIVARAGGCICSSVCCWLRVIHQLYLLGVAFLLVVLLHLMEAELTPILVAEFTYQGMQMSVVVFTYMQCTRHSILMPGSHTTVLQRWQSLSVGSFRDITLDFKLTRHALLAPELLGPQWSDSNDNKVSQMKGWKGLQTFQQTLK